MKQTPTVVLVGGGSIVSGKEIVMLHLARGLRRAGWRVVFITSLWGGRDEFVSRLNADKFDYRRIRMGFISITLGWKPIIWTLDQLRYYPALIFGYLKAIRTVGPQVVIHTNWHHALLLFPFLDRRRDIYWSHEIVSTHHRTAPIFRMIASRVAAVVCVSHAVAKSFAAVGVPRSKIFTVHNGIPLPTVVPPLNVGKTLRLGIVGQVSPWKGHDDLIDALALLLRDGSQFSLQIFGAGAPEYVESLKNRITELNLADRVEWCGFVRDQAEIYSRIDICIVPSRFAEPLATSAIEASGFGRPVICSNRGGLPEVITHGVTGYIFEVQCPDQLAQAIQSFIRNRNLVMTMGEAGRKRIEKEFSLEQCARQFIQVIEVLNVRSTFQRQV